MLSPEQEPQMIQGLLPYSNYSVTVAAVTAMGKGHPVEKLKTTLEEGIFFSFYKIVLIPFVVTVIRHENVETGVQHAYLKTFLFLLKGSTPVFLE